MRKIVSLLLVGFFAIVMLNSLRSIMAAPVGASVSAGTQERYEPSPESLTTQGGNVTEVNVTGYSITSKWAGFWGNVSGGIKIADSSNNVFYEWTVSDPTGGVVYVCSDAVSDWSSSNIQPVYADDSLLPQFLREGSDAFNFTFINQETFTSPSLSIANTNYTTTWQAGSQGTDFKTYALKSVSDSVLIWAGKIKVGETFKGGAYAHYQVLAGVMSTDSTTTFKFYLELP